VQQYRSNMSLNKTPEAVTVPMECPGAPKKPSGRRRVRKGSCREVVEVVREIEQLQVSTPKKPTLAEKGFFTAAVNLGIPLATSTPKPKRRRTRTPSPQDIFA
jgi:hypothetical protein